MVTLVHATFNGRRVSRKIRRSALTLEGTGARLQMDIHARKTRLQATCIERSKAPYCRFEVLEDNLWTTLRTPIPIVNGRLKQLHPLRPFHAHSRAGWDALAVAAAVQSWNPQISSRMPSISQFGRLRRSCELKWTHGSRPKRFRALIAEECRYCSCKTPCCILPACGESRLVNEDALARRRPRSGYKVST
jgi:hypothetical protein